MTLQRGGIGYTPSHLATGRTTLVVHNGRRAAVTFVIVRHSGGMTTLPRYSGMPFIPRGDRRQHADLPTRSGASA